jgi:hypothetical protein
MTCCIEPLIALAGGASIISAIMGVVSRDFVMAVSGIIALFGITGGYYYYKLKLKDKS